MEDLIREVKQMRAAQKLFAQTKDWQDLQVMRTLEKRVDNILIGLTD